MKRKKVIFICLPFICIVCLAFLIYYKYASFTYYDDVVSFDGFVSKDAHDLFIRYYEQIPVSVRTAFKQDGWQISVSSFDLRFGDFLRKNDKIEGKTVYDDKMIYVLADASSAVVHEMGHYLDFKSDFYSDCFPASIYLDEQLKLSELENTHSANYAVVSEFLAESFSVYCLNNKGFKECCPGTYAFLESYLEALHE